jgi:hypothetical protein
MEKVTVRQQLDELQSEAERLVQLLKEREESGMGMGWMMFFGQRMKAIDAIFHQIDPSLGKPMKICFAGFL